MSDPKIPDDAHPSGDPPSDAPPRPGRTAPYARPAPGAFVVPYESLDEDVPPAGASVIVRESYANEVPPVVARPLKQPGEDEPTTRVEVIDEQALAAELAAAGASPSPAADDAPPDGPTRRIAVVTDDDLEDEEARTGAAPGTPGPPGQPAVIVDGPSEAYAAPGADRCPYCLTFVGLSSARTRGVRYCPMCGADWTSLDRKIEAPTGAVIPLGDDILPPIEDALEDHPTNQFTRLGPTRPKPGEAGFVAPPAPPPPRAPTRRAASPWLMLLTGVSLGLAGTMTVAWLYNRRQPPAPTVVAAAPPVPRVSPPVVQNPIEPAPVEPVQPAPVQPAPVKPAPVKPAPVKPAPVKPEPVKPAPVQPEPMQPEPVEPAVVVSEDSVQAAIIDTTSLLPPRARVDIRPRVEGDIVFLTGVVDGTETLGQVITAVAAVEGVRAVDSRGVRPAWKYYTVVKGDSLSKIAQLYYGDTNAWPRVFQSNRDVVKTPSALIPGMKLRIPMSTP